MSDLLKVGSFNMKDNGINRNGGIREDGTSNAKYVANIIKEKEFDLLGTQELTIKYVNELALELHNYQFLGSYRYGNALKFLPYNENNNILTNQKVLETNTIWLPWIANNFPDFKTSIMKASIMPRVATIVVTEDNEHRKICMINTHLDYQVPSIQAKQLEKLKSIILKYSKDYKIILTGDFNMELNDNNFKQFVIDVSSQLKVVDIDGATWHGKNNEEKKEDFIFIPNDFEVENAGRIDANGTSDHDMIYADIRRK
jgi:endonuclease/exonuclease/phosphatase family protein